MKTHDTVLKLGRSAVVLAALVAACGTSGEPRTGGQTNWLLACQADSQCGDLKCLCGACTLPCDDDTSCRDMLGASCVPSQDAGVIALCGGGSLPSSSALCLPRCPSEGCESGTTCVAGMCVPALEPSSNVTIDDSRQFQTLVGVGAGVAYINDEIAMHSQKQALFDAMFSGSGLTMLRLRNRLGDDGADLTSTREIVAAATERQGQAPSILLNSASPPPSLKANDSVWCEGNPDTCTLATLADGSFDYDGFASHWRAILDLYAAEGIMPDYISIQNNPNWVPGVGAANEACRFLPTEGSEEVTTSEATLTVDYPGYVEALDAVVAALDGLASVPQVVAPETTGISSAIEYAAALDFAQVDAIAHHLYSAASLVPVDTEVRTALAELADQQQLPVFQTEMAEDALTTAILMHSSFVVENAAVFIHNGFVGSANSLDDGRVLIHLNEDAFVVGDLYHVMLHYSAHIEPGWVRVAADSDNEDVLASAWRSPEGDATVIVLTNPGITEQVVHVDVRSDASDSIVTRTVLPGVERSANLGALSVDGTVRLPGQSIATVALQR